MATICPERELQSLLTNQQSASIAPSIDDVVAITTPTHHLSTQYTLIPHENPQILVSEHSGNEAEVEDRPWASLPPLVSDFLLDHPIIEWERRGVQYSVQITKKVLGRGEQGTVLLGRQIALRDSNTEEVAVKIEPMPENHDDSNFFEHQAAISLLSQTNIKLKIYHRHQFGSILVTVMSYVKGVNLLEIARTINFGALEDEAARIALSDAIKSLFLPCIVEVSLMHMRQLTHGDLKTDNILVDVVSGVSAIIDVSLLTRHSLDPNEPLSAANFLEACNLDWAQLARSFALFLCPSGAANETICRRLSQIRRFPELDGLITILLSMGHATGKPKQIGPALVEQLSDLATRLNAPAASLHQRPSRKRSRSGDIIQQSASPQEESQSASSVSIFQPTCWRSLWEKFLMLPPVGGQTSFRDADKMNWRMRAGCFWLYNLYQQNPASKPTREQFMAMPAVDLTTLLLNEESISQLSIVMSQQLIVKPHRDIFWKLGALFRILYPGHSSVKKKRPQTNSELESETDK